MGALGEEQLSNLMERHGIEWEDKGTHDKHLSVLDYKKGQRAKEIAALETVKAEKESQVESQERRLKELAPAVKDMERLAADFSTDPEEILPEGRDTGERQVLPGEKGKAPAGEDRQGAALPVPQVHRSKREV